MTVRPRVLVVDDEELLLRSLTRMLTRAGYDVVARSTFASAAAALRDPPPVAVVLTDLRLGSESGLDLIRIARELVPPPGVIVFSGAADADDVDAAMGAGAKMILRKPVQPAELVEAVASAM